jgi:hypothetical protein
MMPKPIVCFLAALLAVTASIISSAQTGAPPESGIFLQRPGGALTLVPGTVSEETQTKGVAKSILTQGISKSTTTVRHLGASATFVITDPQPSFLFRFFDLASGSQQAREAHQSRQEYLDTLQRAGKQPLMGKDPKEYVLTKLEVDGDARVASTKGLPTFKLDIKKTSEREFEVHVAEPLGPGEYAFFMNAYGGTPVHIWAFSVKGR